MLPNSNVALGGTKSILIVTTNVVETVLSSFNDTVTVSLPEVMPSFTWIPSAVISNNEVLINEYSKSSKFATDEVKSLDTALTKIGVTVLFLKVISLVFNFTIDGPTDSSILYETLTEYNLNWDGNNNLNWLHGFNKLTMIFDPSTVTEPSINWFKWDNPSTKYSLFLLNLNSLK